MQIYFDVFTKSFKPWTLNRVIWNFIKLQIGSFEILSKYTDSFEDL